jgi:hypothetical protein
MAKFKKGDRVRLVKVTSLELANNIFVGDTGTVLEDGSESFHTFAWINITKILFERMWSLRRRSRLCLNPKPNKTT